MIFFVTGNWHRVVTLFKNTGICLCDTYRYRYFCRLQIWSTGIKSGGYPVSDLQICHLDFRCISRSNYILAYSFFRFDSSWHSGSKRTIFPVWNSIPKMWELRHGDLSFNHICKKSVIYTYFLNPNDEPVPVYSVFPYLWIWLVPAPVLFTLNDDKSVPVHDYFITCTYE
jgi:hypothetical protein